MGLCVSVGMLADLAENDPEMLEDVQRDFEIINEVLGHERLPGHSEPSSLPPLDDRTPVVGFPYSFLHFLRRFYARLIDHPGSIPPPVQKGEDPSKDASVDRVGSIKHHILWHSDCEGYYVPVNFPLVLESEDLPGITLGSSFRLMEELISVAEPLGIKLEDGQLSDDIAETIGKDDENHPYYRERVVWMALFEASRLSLEHHTAIVFG